MSRTTFNTTTVSAELTQLGVDFDPPIDWGDGRIRVTFTKSKNDHHDQNFIRAYNYYKSGQSPISALNAIGRYEVWLNAK